MYLLLDANLLIRDKGFNHTLWRLVAARPDSWSLTVAIPWAAFREVVGHQVKLLQEYEVKARSLHNDVMRSDAVASIDGFCDDLLREADQFEDKLRQRLTGARVAIIDKLESIDHHTLVKRAIDRRRPCKERTGDGYRDTLNWMTVLQLAREIPDEKIVWATEDGDFFDGESMHQHLVEDLLDIGAGNRVQVVKGVRAAQMAVVDEYKTGSDVSATTKSRILELVREEVIKNFNLDIVECGLPLTSRSHYGRVARIIDSTIEVEDLNWEGGDTQRAEVLPFVVDMDAECVLFDSSRSDGSPIESVERTRKDLVVTGGVGVDLVTRAPKDVSIDAVRGRPGDPVVIYNRIQVQRFKEASEILSASSLQDEQRIPSILTPDDVERMAQAIRPAVASEDLVKRMAEMMRPAVASEDLVKRMAEMMRPAVASEDLVKRMAEMTRPAVAGTSCAPGTDLQGTLTTSRATSGTPNDDELADDKVDSPDSDPDHDDPGSGSLE